MWSSLIGRVGVFAVGVLLCAAGLSQLHAQQSGTISGTVLDQTGKPIQDAVVELKSDSTGASRSVISDAEGKFQASDLAGRELLHSSFSARFRLDHSLRRTSHRRRDPGHSHHHVG